MHKILVNLLRPPYRFLRKLVKKVCNHILAGGGASQYLKNVYKTDFQKKVLLSYITRPFLTQNNYGHTNWLECKTAGDVFSSLGFQVDVVNLNDDVEIPYNEYDVVYGMGLNLEKSFYINNKNIIRIFYATGCNTEYSNYETLQKSKEFYKKTGLFGLSSTRELTINQDKQRLLASKVIVLGNYFTLDTYTRFDKNNPDLYENLPCFFYDTVFLDLTKKNFEKAKRNFLWFGSSGLLHKGLDTVIDIFLEDKSINLFICGASQYETDFWEYYKPLIEKASNISDLGFIDIQSEKFKELLNTCAFVVFPSVSEGGSPSLLNLMGNGGIIPITSVRSGVDLPDEIEVISEDNQKNEYKRLIRYYLDMNQEQLRAISVKLQKYVCENYSYSNYKNNLTRIIKDCIAPNLPKLS